MTKKPSEAKGDGLAKAPPAAAAARVYVLYTGGTFGMAPDPATPGHPLRVRGLERLRGALTGANAVPEGVAVTLEPFERLIDSASMTPADWFGVAGRIAANYASHDGFVVIQGTDTLAYTASALSFLFENLGKPVVVTGAMAPWGDRRGDAKRNYRNALAVAGHRASGLPLVPEVVVVFADRVLRGSRARKMHANALAAFDSPNCPPLGAIGREVTIFRRRVRPAPPAGSAFRVNGAPAAGVLDITLHPGLRPGHLRAMLALEGVKGAVLRTYGAGNAPGDERFIAALREGIAGDKVVVNVTQCPQGSVEMGLYAASVALIDNCVISGFDMTPEAALTKLMVTMGSRPAGQVKSQMQISQRGEQSQNLFDFNFKIPGKPTDGPWSDCVAPDRRFDQTALSTAVLRMKAMQVTVAADAVNPVVDLYMNFPAAKQDATEKATHPRRLHRIQLTKSDTFDVVEILPKEEVKNVIGDSDVTLTFVPSKGVSMNFDKLSLSVFTRA